MQTKRNLVLNSLYRPSQQTLSYSVSRRVLPCSNTTCKVIESFDTTRSLHLSTQIHANLSFKTKAIKTCYVSSLLSAAICCWELYKNRVRTIKFENLQLCSLTGGVKVENRFEKVSEYVICSNTHRYSRIQIGGWMKCLHAFLSGHAGFFLYLNGPSDSLRLNWWNWKSASIRFAFLKTCLAPQSKFWLLACFCLQKFIVFHTNLLRFTHKHNTYELMQSSKTLNNTSIKYFYK